MTTENIVLLQILAEIDATWLPMRREDWSSHGSTNVSVARLAYPARGVEWIPSGTLAERERLRRASVRLVDAGYIARLAGGGVLLTDRGAAIARAMCDLPGLREAWIAAGALEHFAQAGSWIGEVVIAANDRRATYGSLGPASGRLLASNESFYFPSLCRGYAISNSTAAGHVFFRLTPEGATWARAPGRGRPTDLPEPSTEACDVYLAARTAYRTKLRTDPPFPPREVGPPALPESGGAIRDRDGWSDPLQRPRRRTKRKVEASR